jgi:GTPase Era involved in 16S rRNA processing
VETESGRKKILLLGLDNSGKSSIVLSMKGTNNLLSYMSLTPTQRRSIELISSGNTFFAVWDTGGQFSYRQLLLDQFQEYAINIDKVIFVIDIQAQDRYSESLEYLTQIIDKFQQIKIFPKLFIFLHKFDPGLEEKIEYSPHVIRENLLSKIEVIIPSSFSPEFFKSTIYTVFHKIPITF